MPFPQQDPRLFTREGIEWLAPSQRGCYGIFRAGLWIYVGKTDDLRRRLLEHLWGDNPRITIELPIHFVTMLTTNDVLAEKQLIRELDPVANRQVG
jgi:excinuclease UvrABC nuclease subunit